MTAAGAGQWYWAQPPPSSNTFNYSTPAYAPAPPSPAFNYSGYPDWWYSSPPSPDYSYYNNPPSPSVYWDPSNSTSPYLGYNNSFFYDPTTPYWTTSSLANGTSSEGRYSVVVDVKVQGECMLVASCSCACASAMLTTCQHRAHTYMCQALTR